LLFRDAEVSIPAEKEEDAMSGEKKRKSLGLIAAGLILGLALSSLTVAEDDPSIKGKLRQDIQTSMKSFIRSETIDGAFYLYDPVEGKLLRLKFDKLHEGIVRKADFYVSCADFVDQNGRKVDVDLLVRDSTGKLITTQAIVHAVNDSKREYHLESK
jgi:hypothetical protein